MKNQINVVFIGDIFGEAGLSVFDKYKDQIKQTYQPDLIIANGENADKGKGITETEANKLFEMGINIITTGNHIWENWKSKPLLVANTNIIRPYNFPPGNVGKGYTIFKINDEIEVGIINIQGRTFMPPIDCPFRGVDSAIKNISTHTKNIIVDFHAETTAEKMAMGWYVDGRVSALVGTHTHIPTADATILPQGTAYITDVGMTGPFDSIVGLKKEIGLKRFLLQTAHKFEIATEDAKVCGVAFTIDTSTNQAIKIEQFTFPKFVTSIMEQLEN